jgi:hypothetical protein
MGRDWRKGFTPITNQRKLANGAFVGWALFRALATVHYKFKPNEQSLLAPFDGLVTEAMLQFVRNTIPFVSPYAHRPDDFASGRFPFEAYRLTSPERANA